MALTITHQKTDNIADWTQADLDAEIALGNYPPGTVLADIVLPSDWNDDHAIAGSLAAADVSVDNSTFEVLTATDAQDAFDQIDQALLNARSTGVRYGGLGSINVSGTTVDVTAGQGGILDNSTPSSPTYTPVTWSAYTNVSLVSTSPSQTYWYIDNTGTLQQQTSVPTPEEYRTKIFLFRTSYTGGAITGISVIQVQLQQNAVNIRDLAKAVGVVRQSGASPTASGANLKLKVTAGIIYDYGVLIPYTPTNPSYVNAPTFDSGAGDVFRYITSSGVIATDVTDIDVGHYQVAGVVTAIPSPSTRWSVTYVFGLPSGNTRTSYANTYYNNLQDALAGISSTNPYDTVPAALLGNSFVLGAIAAPANATNLTTQATFVTTNKFGGFGGSLASSGTSYVQGPASATDSALALYDGTTGKLVKNSAVTLSSTVLAPTVNDSTALGTGSLAFSDLFLAAGGVVDFGNGDVTITNSTNQLSFAGATTAYTFGNGGAVRPASNDGSPLGTATASWSDLFLASGGVINWNNGTYTLTQAAGALTASGTLAASNLSGTNTGDQTITLTGDVTGSGTGSFATTIANSAVTLAKIANASANSKLLGAGAAGSGAAYTEITLGTNLSMSGTTLNATGGGSSPLTTKGDIYTYSTVDARLGVGTDGQVLTADSTQTTGLKWATVSGTGDVVGPASATDNAVARFDATTGKLIQNSVVIIDDSGNTSGVGTLAAGVTTLTSANVSAFAVGPNGTTNPALSISTNVASAVTGISLVGRAAGSGVSVNATSSGASEDLLLSSKGAGFATLIGGSSGSVRLSPGGSARITCSTSSFAATTLVDYAFGTTTSSTASTVRFSYSGSANTLLTNTTEFTQVYFNMAQNNQHASSGTVTLQRDMRISGMTHSAQTATKTFTDTAVLAIDGYAQGGSNAAITNGHGIYIPAQAVAGTVTTASAITTAAPSGATNNYAAKLGGVVIDDLDTISGFKTKFNNQTGTTYTLLSTDTGKTVTLTNASAITVTLPNNLAIGFTCELIQGGAGQVTFSAASGATLQNRQSFTKIAGQYGAVRLVVVTNSGGTSAVYNLAGDAA